MTHDDEPTTHIVVTKDAKTLPVVEILTGRGFITGKSGSGKSNTASVIAEELLEANYNMLIVDTEGEYWGLKERYDLLHVGNGDQCDAKVGIDHADKITEIALERNMPIILDVSEYTADDADTLIHDVVNGLFEKEKDLEKPFLLIVEEIQEYVPQGGGSDALKELLLRVAKRGRKRGLGLCGISQRPAAVDKDFITQCDWLVWHRLTWENDIDVVDRLLGNEIADQIADLDDGEAFLMTDWDGELTRVQFRRKKTFDAGATPGLKEFERPDLKSVGQELIGALEGNETVDIKTSEDLDLTTDASSSESPESSPVETSPDDDLNLLVQEMENQTVESDSPEELRRLLQEERKRNEILQDEVRELKQIIDSISNNGEDVTGNSVSAGNGRESVGTSKEQRLFSEPKHDGNAGVVVELGLLTTYLFLRGARGVSKVGLWIKQALLEINYLIFGTPDQHVISGQQQQRKVLWMIGVVSIVILLLAIIGIIYLVS